MKKNLAGLISILIMVVIFSVGVFSQTTEFTYQGSLQNGGTAASGNYDFEFLLFDASVGGSQIGSTITRNSVGVASGVFTVNLDFGAGFPGASRFLEIHVRPTGGGAFTPLTPRQAVTSAPYSVKSLIADTATNATTAATANNALQLGGVAASQYVLTGDARLANERAPTAGSAHYVQNTAVQQPASSFNISGTGTANIFNAAAQYNIGGIRVLSVAGSDNFFAGVGAGHSNMTGGANSFFGSLAGFFSTTGNSNSFFGSFAGQSNTTGGDNSFFGRSAGFSNTTGSENSFFGRSAGAANTTGGNNAFFGRGAGSANITGNSNTFSGAFAGGANTTGGSNSFFGRDAGSSNTAGSSNSFFGAEAGHYNTTGDSNSFFGLATGQLTTGSGNAFFGTFAGPFSTTGSSNSFFGVNAGLGNTTGSSNTLLGSNANVGSTNLSFATAIGSGATVTFSNSVVLGRSNGSDSVRIPGTALIDGSLMVGTLSGAGSTQLCRNLFELIATCSSSLRYKTSIAPFRLGLSLINQLRPIAYNWKDSGMKDVGFAAEDVERINPLFVTYNAAGEVEGVKYDRIGAVLVNAVKEQQRQIESQQKKIGEQNESITLLRSEVEMLKVLVCIQNPAAGICKPRN